MCIDVSEYPSAKSSKADLVTKRSQNHSILGRKLIHKCEATFVKLLSTFYEVLGNITSE